MEDYSGLVNDLQRVAYTMGIQLQARIELEGMIAENQYRLSEGKTIAYIEKDFIKLRDEHGIHHNGLLSNINRPF